MAEISSISGTIKTVTFHNPETGYFVAKIISANKERTVVGNAPSLHVGEVVHAEGTWATSNWGPQFKATSVKFSTPSSLEGIERYLCSSVEGVGKSFAKKLVDAFGDKLFDVIEHHPEKLKSLPGIGKKRVDSLVESYNNQKALRKIMVYLHQCGLSSNRANKVFDKYVTKQGMSVEDTIKMLSENPYVLCKDIWGIGFSIADEAALKQGVKKDSPNRIRAGILYILDEYSGRGSCGTPEPILREKAAEILGVPLENIDLAIRAELADKGIIRDTVGDVQCLFLPKIYAAELAVARRLLFLAKRSPVKPISNIDASISEAEVKLGIELDEVQRDAVRVAVSNQVCVITGGPGTGKSTITKVILHIFENESLTPIVLCAPTGKAAKRASEATGMPGITVHRALKIGPDGKFKHNASNPLEADVFDLDEASMMDVPLTNSLLDAISVTTRVIITGDVDQLPSVGPGKVLADIIDSKVLPTVKLTKIFRQAANSDIIKNAHAINRGEMPTRSDDPNSDFKFVTIDPINWKDDEEKAVCRKKIESYVLSVVKSAAKNGYHPIKDVQVLAPMRKGPLGIISLNVVLQSVLNPNPPAHTEYFGTTWKVNDKVMQLVNNYDKDVFNGDIGYIEDIDVLNKDIVVNFDGKPISYKFSELDELCLAYAMSIHKSQGSEFPVVVIPIESGHYMMLKRNLLYTAVTRAKKRCFLIGMSSAIKTAVQSNQNDDRFSKLKEWLIKGVPSELLNSTAY